MVRGNTENEMGIELTERVYVEHIDEGGSEQEILRETREHMIRISLESLREVS